MALIRRFEERAAELFQQGVIFGTAHSCVGQEAIAVGAAGVMRDTDYLVGHHRSHGHLIAAGADLRRMMAEMFGKRTGYCKGLGGSMHIADLSLDILGCNGIVGAGIPHACGAALTAKLRGTGQAAVAFFGDGAAGQGAAHEGMNLAATWTLPVVFICENNQFALSADWRTQRAVEDLADRAAGYGMPGEVVDGNDLARGRGGGRAGARPGARGRRPDVARDEDVPADAALDAREPARRPRPGARRGVGGEGPAAAARAAAARARRARRRRRSRPSAQDVEREVELAIETALADEDASADDLLPAVLAPQRSYPAPPRRDGARARLRRRRSARRSSSSSRPTRT